MTAPSDPIRSAALEPCPFCGGKPFKVHSGPPDGAVIRCGDCSARTVSDYAGEAEKQWNKRVSPKGCKLVPVDPTDEMTLAASKVDRVSPMKDQAIIIWDAMLAAAPHRPFDTGATPLDGEEK